MRFGLDKQAWNDPAQRSLRRGKTLRLRSRIRRGRSERVYGYSGHLLLTCLGTSSVLIPTKVPGLMKSSSVSYRPLVHGCPKDQMRMRMRSVRRATTLQPSSYIVTARFSMPIFEDLILQIRFALKIHRTVFEKISPSFQSICYISPYRW